MNQKEAYIEKAKARLDEFGAEIDRLEAEAAKKKAQGSAEYHQRLADLKGHQKKLGERVEQLKDASGDAWGEIVAGADRVTDEMKKSFEKVRAALR